MPVIFGRRRKISQASDEAAPSTGVGSAHGPEVVEDLGTVTTASGELLLIDFGLVNLWSGDSAPQLDARDVGDELAETANQAVDLRIVGDDPVAAGRAVDLVAVQGRYVFDIPAPSLEEMRERIVTRAAEHGFAVSLEPMARMPHRTRVARLLDDSPEGAEVLFGGPWAWAIRGLPADRPLPVRGVRMPSDGPDAGRWQSVWVEVAPQPPVRTEDAGYVAVDEARLAFVDPEVLGLWRTGEPVDGLADLAFWGRDEDLLAERTGAGIIDEHARGWTDLPFDQALDRAHELQRIRESGELRFAFDFRPHDDHHRLLSIARQAATESASIQVGSETVCGFFTSWGDGMFPVRRDLAEDGTLCRIRAEVGAPEIVERQRRSDERWSGEFARFAFVSARVARDGTPIGWLYREAPDGDQDSGWRIFAGDESDEYNDDPANIAVLPLRDLLGQDQQLEAILRTAAPVAFERDPDGTFRAAPSPPVRD